MHRFPNMFCKANAGFVEIVEREITARVMDDAFVFMKHGCGADQPLESGVS